ncbi:MAG: hypothetical protein K2Q12_05360 [Rickettsiales bacterium]|nr:hypothetical protein [Rickettsiales bacterium]
MDSEWIKVPHSDVTINMEVAHEIRRLRVEEGCSWSAISEHLAERFPDEDYGGGNQAFAYNLCKTAAEMLGEDANIPPWN